MDGNVYICLVPLTLDINQDDGFTVLPVYQYNVSSFFFFTSKVPFFMMTVVYIMQKDSDHYTSRQTDTVNST